MSVLTYVDVSEGAVRKSSLEALCYGSQLAARLGVASEAVVLGSHPGDLSELGGYGVTRVHHVSDAGLDVFDTRRHAAVVAAAAGACGAVAVVLSHSLNGRALGPRLAVRLGAGYAAGVIALPETEGGFRVRRNVFSGKAQSELSLSTPRRVLTVQPNAFGVTRGEGRAEVVAMAAPEGVGRVRVVETRRVTGTVPLGEAERVVSGGRGLKGPEHWGMVEELAELLGAATACSRAVADAHWRPHHEHVGQTGLAIAPNLYFAIGISGAIQHLAGVNRSKVIVVVNKDPEAPFFKAADYGIVGDAFEVMPKVIEAVRRLKAG
jgi:electron transfer flavoprotein alpha subunit